MYFIRHGLQDLLKYGTITLYLLNGMLYDDPKILFPFLPLALTLTADMLKELSGFKDKKVLIGFVIVSAIAFLASGMNFLMGVYLCDAVIVTVTVTIYVFIRTHKRAFIALFFAVPLFSCLFACNYDELMTRKSYETANSQTVSRMISELPADTIFRTAVDTERLQTVNKIYSPNHYSDTLYSSLHSQDYNSFYFNEMYNENEYRNSALTARSKNIFFNSYMGNRYLITKNPVTYFGHEVLKSDSGFYL